MAEIRFDGRVAVITGAGGGLGKTYALLLASRGASVVVNDLGGAVDGSGKSVGVADAAVQEIERAGGKAVASHDSVATPDGAEKIIQTAVNAFGKVDIVINNAGILRDKSFAKMTPEDFDLVLGVHLRGAFHVSQAAFRVMKEHQYGRFVFTSSAAGLFGNFGQANYAAAKIGLVGLSNVLAIEGARYNILSNAIAPLASTRMSQDLMGPLAVHFESEHVTPMVAYLASEECSLSHEIFSAGAGRYARVFVGLTPGWFAGREKKATPEDIRGHIDQIRDLANFVVPGSVTEEFLGLGQLLQS